MLSGDLVHDTTGPTGQDAPAPLTPEQRAMAARIARLLADWAEDGDENGEHRLTGTVSARELTTWVLEQHAWEPGTPGLPADLYTDPYVVEVRERLIDTLVERGAVLVGVPGAGPEHVLVTLPQ